jgi:microcompartment protein CcmL/EutN
MTEEGPVVIEVRGDSLLISESMDAGTTKKVEGDYWGEGKPNGQSER